MKERFWYTVAVLLSLISVAWPQSPKLLIVDVDDLGRDFLEAYPTPFFQYLEQNARKYENFYTAPVCSPTRAMMQYGVRATHPDLECGWLITDLVNPTYHTPTDGPLEPLGSALTSHGLTTAKVGKWHLSEVGNTTHPNECGWQFYAGAMTNIGDFYNYPAVVNGNQMFVQGAYVTDLETQVSIALMGLGVDVVSVSYHSIHMPFHVPPAGTFSGPTDTDVQKAVAMLENLDLALQQLASSAYANGYTMILFGDNGTLGVLGTGGAKGCVCDRGVRTWMYCIAPDGSILPGQDDSLVGVYDIYRTAFEFFGKVPAADQGPESVSFVPTWGGMPNNRTSVFTDRYSFNGEPPVVDSEWHSAVRGPRYKYRRHFGNHRFFDMLVDPFETNNLLGGFMTQDEHAEYISLLNEWSAWTQ